MPTIQMTEEEAKKILGKTIQEDGSLYNRTEYVDWHLGSKTVTLDASFFTAEQLMAIAWWMTNKTS